MSFFSKFLSKIAIIGIFEISRTSGSKTENLQPKTPNSGRVPSETNPLRLGEIILYGSNI